MAAGVALLVSLTTCSGKGGNVDDVNFNVGPSREAAAELNSAVRDLNADQPWMALVKKISYEPSGLDLEKPEPDQVYVSTTINGSDGLTSAESETATQICQAVVEALPEVKSPDATPDYASVTIEGPDNGIVASCDSFTPLSPTSRPTTTT